MAEPTVHPAVDAVSRVMDQYDEQCADNPAWAVEAADEVAAVRNAIDRCRGAVARAVREQPTPTAEPERAGAWTTFQVEHTGPPRIEDMAPGPTFTARVRWPGAVDDHFTVMSGPANIWLRGEQYEVTVPDRIDPSTIRDVTPPKEHA